MCYVGPTMFSGYIEHTVTLLTWRAACDTSKPKSSTHTPIGARMQLSRPPGWASLRTGHSVNVNGVCLTVEELHPAHMQFFLSPDTLHLTQWAKKTPDTFNVERALKFGARLQGHLVTGHAEGLAQVENIEAQAASKRMTFSYPPHLSPYIWSQCSLCLNGVSLTVQSVQHNQLTVSLVPETLKRSNLKQLQLGERVVLECDHSHRYFNTLGNNKGRVGAQTHNETPRQASTLHSTAELVTEVQRGHMVILVDDEGRENEGDIIMPADFITPEAVNFIVSQAKGLMCLAMDKAQMQKLQLPPMVPPEQNATAHKTAFMRSIEAATGIGTGISAADRARTVWVASRPEAKATDVISPGHVFPLQAHPGGVHERAGHTEASVDLMRLAGLNPAAVICEVMRADGTMARLPDLLQFGQRYGIKVGSIENLIHSLKVGPSISKALSGHP